LRHTEPPLIWFVECTTVWRSPSDLSGPKEQIPEGGLMAVPIRQFSRDHHLPERMKFSWLDKNNLADLVSIVVSLKNKYSITPFAATPKGHSVSECLTVRYIMEGTTLNKMMNILLDTPKSALLIDLWISITIACRSAKFTEWLCRKRLDTPTVRRAWRLLGAC
jgi:hypothetical protein